MAQTISNIYYNIPQDKDDPDIPNVFCIPKSLEEIKLADIRQYFPLNGQYIFRFKYKYNNQPVWMDIPETSKKLPIYEGRIFVKATRISWGEQQKKQEPAPQQQQQNTVTQNQQNKQQQQQQQQQQQESNTPNRQTSNQYIDFFGDDDENKSSSNQSNVSQQGSNLLDFDM